MIEGFVLAAGLGTRLRPLTDTRPKALVTVGGRTLLELAIDRLASAGATLVVVNVHHWADMVESYLAGRQWPCRVVVSDERSQLLDTGGALRHAAPLFSGCGPVLVHNVDVLSRVDLQEAVRCHEAERNLATLCVSRRDTKRLLAFDGEGLLRCRCTADAVPEGCRPMAFSGISVVNPALFELLPADDHPYPVIDEYVRLSAAHHRIAAFEHDPAHWLDVGRPETLEQAQQWILS